MSFNPANTRWAVTSIDNDCVLGMVHGTPWEFFREAMIGRNHWVGGYAPIPGVDNAYICEYILQGSYTPSPPIVVTFITPDRFIATENGKLTVLGKKL